MNDLAAGGLRFAVESIGPSLATQYLERNRFNRPLSRAVVLNYVDALRAGEWLLNGEAIKFDTNGLLVDGQHRLDAIVRSGVAAQLVVIRDLDPEVFKTLDTGKNRSAGDVLAIKGVKNPNAVGVALRLLHRTQQHDFKSKRRVTNTQLEEICRTHPRILELMDEADHAPYSNPYVPPGQRMFAFYMAVSIDERKARAFFRALGGRPDTADVAQPHAIKLREWLTKVSDEYVQPSTKVKLAWLIETWNAWLERTPVQRYSRLIKELPDWEPAPKFTVKR